MRVIGFTAVLNGVALGYPFIESILSALPLVDEFWIADGGSTDETVQTIARLAKAFPGHIVLHFIPWVKSKYWAGYDAVLSELIDRAADGEDWMFEVQGDEFYHEKDLDAWAGMIRYADRNRLNSIRGISKNYKWDRRDKYDYFNVRLFRKIPGVHSRWGGDDFQVGEERAPRDGFTSHNVPPEIVIGLETFHMHRLFPMNQLEQDRTNTEYCGGAGTRKEAYERSKQVNWAAIKPPKPEDVMDCLPAIIKGMSQETLYRVRDELFDPTWLTKETGVDYASIANRSIQRL